MKKLLLLSIAFCLVACTPKTYISSSYNFSKMKGIGILPFKSPDNVLSGAENLFAKYLIKYGYKVIERAQIEQVLKEQNLSVDGYLSPDATRKIGKVLGVDALLIGEITSFLPEQKTLAYNVSHTSKSEPVFNNRIVKDKDGKTVITSTYAGQQSTRQKEVYPSEYSIYAQIGVVAKLVDVNTAEVIWVGDDTRQGVSGLDALDSSAKGLVKSFNKNMRKALKHEGR